MKRLVSPVYASSDATVFHIPVKWEVRSEMEVRAKSLKAAVQYVNRKEFELPSGKYVDDTFEIDYDRLEE